MSSYIIENGEVVIQAKTSVFVQRDPTVFIKGEKGDKGNKGDPGEAGIGIQGPQGLQGDTGPPGKSAYQVAIDNGFTGTEQDWLNSLKPPTITYGTSPPNNNDGNPEGSIYIQIT